MLFSRPIRVYGDSILKGVQLDETTNTYILPKENNLEKWGERLSLFVRNYSKFGCTVEKGFALMRRQLEKWKASDGEGQVVLLEYGGNDSDYDWAQINADPSGEYRPHTELPVFRRVLARMAEFLREQGMVPVLLNLPPIDALRYFRWICRSGTDIQPENLLRWMHEPQVIYRSHELYSSCVCQVAFETNTPLLDVRSEFLKRRDCKSLLCEDGIHPSAAGHRLIQSCLSAFAGQLPQLVQSSRTACSSAG